MAYNKVVLPVKLERGLVKEMDELIKEHKFSSKAEIIRYGIRLVTLFERKKLPLDLHERAERYLYEDSKKRFKDVS